MPGMRRGKRQPPPEPPDDDRGGPEWTFVDDPERPGQKKVRNDICFWCGLIKGGPHVGKPNIPIYHNEQGNPYHRLYSVGKKRLYFKDQPGDVEEATARGYDDNNFNGGICPDCIAKQKASAAARRAAAQAQTQTQTPPPPPPPPDTGAPDDEHDAGE